MIKSRLSIIIVNYNNPELIEACLDSIDTYLKAIDKEVLIVDNNSSEQFLTDYLEIYPYLKVIFLPKNMGFGYANNVGVMNAVGDVILLLNSDAEFFDSSFNEAYLSFLTLTTPELWGVKLVWPNGKFQQSYTRQIDLVSYIMNYTPLYFLFRSMNIGADHKYNHVEYVVPTEVDVVYATAILIKKYYFKQLHGFSKKYFMYFEDLDLCDRFKREINGVVKFYPHSSVIHRVKGSSGYPSFDYKFIKSKYIYGISRFGYFVMAVIIPFDISLELIKFNIKKVVAMLSIFRKFFHGI